LPYDKSLIPTGYTQQDIRTFYYDERIRPVVGICCRG